jgi:hypothetical protein
MISLGMSSGPGSSVAQRSHIRVVRWLIHDCVVKPGSLSELTGSCLQLERLLLAVSHG